MEMLRSPQEKVPDDDNKENKTLYKLIHHGLCNEKTSVFGEYTRKLLINTLTGEHNEANQETSGQSND